MENPLSVIVLAAGEGVRMRSGLPKVLHRLCGKPMLRILLDTLEGLSPRRLLLVIGHGADMVKETIGPGYEYILQEEQLGTGHAVMVTEKFLEPDDVNLLIMAGDVPLVTKDTLEGFTRFFLEKRGDAALITMEPEDPSGYGRILRDSSGEVRGIVEEEDASREEIAIKEVNASIYIFRREALFRCLRHIGRDNRKGEYYLTDAIRELVKGGGKVLAWKSTDPTEVLGINSRDQLAEAVRIMQKRINQHWMSQGVTIVDPRQTYIEMDVQIERDTIIHPFTFLKGSTKIGEACEIGPFCRIQNSILGKDVVVEESVIRECVIDEGARIGPYASLRPGTHVSSRAKVGTFVELKNTQLGRGSKVPHLSYMGDALIGEDVNIGAGSITCNYDGVSKHQTVIEDEAFIGSDTMFIAPVRIGKGAVTGAGSAITKDVPPESLGVERAEQRNIKDWRKRRSGEQGGKR